MVFLYSLEVDGFTVEEAFRIKGGDLRINPVLEWNGTMGDVLTSEVTENNMWERRKDLEGIVLSNAFQSSYPAEWCETDPANDNKISAIYGIFPEVYNALATHTNFTYTLVFSSDRKFGVQDETTHEWNGIIKYVNNATFIIVNI